MTQRAPAAGLAIAAVVAATIPFTTSFERIVPHAYRDPAGVSTECIGETRNVLWGVTFTRAQCQAMLANRLTKDYAPQILKCVPALATRPSAFEAALDASYNAGTSAFCRSPMAKAFNAGGWTEGCARFIGWRVTARGQIMPGLIVRRRDEAATCVKGLPDA